MEERSFQLNDEVVVEDDRGEVGKGVVVGRAFANPMRYDVLIKRWGKETIYASMPHGTLRYVQ